MSRRFQEKHLRNFAPSESRLDFDTKFAWRVARSLWWRSLLNGSDEKQVVRLPDNEDVGVFFGGIASVLL